MIKKYFDNLIAKSKRQLRVIKKKIPDEKDPRQSKEYRKAKNELYQAINMKEVWLRKFMYQLGLYLKEVEYNPAGAMWGK